MRGPSEEGGRPTRCIWGRAGVSFLQSAPGPMPRSVFDQYVSDPAQSVPVLGEIGAGVPADYMTYDQRFASRRDRCAGVSD